MHLDDLLTVGKADAGAFILIPGMQSLEDDEDPLEELVFHADAVVTDHELPMTLLKHRGHPYFRGTVAVAEFDSVDDEILEEQFQLCGIGVEGRQITCRYVGATFPDTLAQVGLDLVYQHVTVDGPCLFFSTDTGIVKQVFDQDLHPVRCLREIGQDRKSVV